MSEPIATPRPLTGRIVLVCLIAFFGTVIGVNMLMMKFAIDTLPGTEVDSAYRASLAYRNEISAADEQSRRNWKVDAHVERRADGAATVRLDARDANGKPLSGLKFSGLINAVEFVGIQVVPEPGSLALAGIGVLAHAAWQIVRRTTVPRHGWSAPILSWSRRHG